MRQQDSKPVRDLAYAQAGVVSRRQLLGLGLTRWQIVAQLRAGRWRAHGRQTISVHTGELGAAAMRWYAVFEAGPRGVIDGVSALVAAGLTGWQTENIRVSVPRGAPAVRRRGLMVRQTRRLRNDDVIKAGLPRVRPDIAAVRAGLWAVTDRQAATVMAMVVQQRLTTAEAIGKALLDIKRHKRRKFLERVVLDLLEGSQSMGELDFARLCRYYGLPTPDRQTIRKTSKGRESRVASYPQGLRTLTLYYARRGDRMPDAAGPECGPIRHIVRRHRTLGTAHHEGQRDTAR